MSFNTIAQANADNDLRTRTNACCEEQARTDPAHNATPLADLIRLGRADVTDQFQWIVALAGQAAYESAVIGGNPRPGHDESVIADAAILSAVQTNWDTVQAMFT